MVAPRGGELNPVEIKNCICSSWQRDLVFNLWKSKALSTNFEVISKNKKWLIYFQASQDGHPADKTKEMAGRCRSFKLSWLYHSDPRSREQFSFTWRDMPQVAYILDGEWTATQKQNLYEAGWDWVGDVSQLGELRQLIQADDPVE